MVRRTPGSAWAGVPFSFAQTMLRVKDPQLSLFFYVNTLGMTLQLERHFGAEAGDFSLFFLQDSAQIEATAFEKDRSANLNASFHPALELTHNHGTENDVEFSYHSGNSEPRGFGQVLFFFFIFFFFCLMCGRTGTLGSSWTILTDFSRGRKSWACGSKSGRAKDRCENSVFCSIPTATGSK
jgi:catechol 2,3-dioxygenase-like lactoylglutathione lyase family enzyme